MKGNNTDPSSRIKQIDHRIQIVLQHFQFVIQFNSDCLKRTLCRISSGLLHFHRDGLPNNFRQFPRRCNRLLLSLVHYMFCNIFCKFIFTVIADDPIEIHLAVVIDNIPCRKTLSVIHAHIKRRIGVPVGKSPLRCVKLER